MVSVVNRKVPTLSPAALVLWAYCLKQEWGLGARGTQASGGHLSSQRFVNAGRDKGGEPAGASASRRQKDSLCCFKENASEKPNKASLTSVRRAHVGKRAEDLPVPCLGAVGSFWGLGDLSGLTTRMTRIQN